MHERIEAYVKSQEILDVLRRHVIVSVNENCIELVTYVFTCVMKWY